MLTKQEQDYFNKIVEDIKNKLCIDIPILSCNHEILKGHEEALGIAYSYDKADVYQITIDEYFIHECYYDFLWNQGYRDRGIVPKVEIKSLEDVICHEIAHITYWNHGKKHRELTDKLLIKLCA
ncbi:hypothetical protein HZI73_26360 (plasmid) [Vallitalea pronyensis]|uniref:Uncharacterized protein n=1 Tax=Vallitalea pronyensis TaxID=1348613 RepID=A0A8J8MQU4_9FIRM|nr:hypothetical protein [Vallitalea pronyensis]QUI25939.1 hypothetical protein HZI73_26360 [Vallitalea pronyensis]